MGTNLDKCQKFLADPNMLDFIPDEIKNMDPQKELLYDLD